MPEAGLPMPALGTQSSDGEIRVAPAALPKVVIVTTFFPSERNPHRTVFVRNLATAMRSGCEIVQVVVPIAVRPWKAWRELLQPPPREEFAGFTLSRPHYASIPGLNALAGLMYFLSVRKQLRDLVRQHGRFVVHVHCAYPDAVGVALAVRSLDLPYVVTAHGSDVNVYGAKPASRIQMRWALRRAAAVVAVSRALKARIESMVGIPKDRVRCIACAGFDPLVFAPRPVDAARRDLGLPLSGRQVVFVGQLVHIKGLEFLVQAWSELQRRAVLQPADRLVLVGAGPLEEKLQRQTREGGVEASVRFVGVVPQTDVVRWVASSDLLCLPSRAEGMPNVIVEALAMGVPVVASRVGGIPEMLSDDVNGLMVPPEDAAALAAALERALLRPWDRERIRASVEQNSWAQIAALNCRVLRAAATESQLERVV